MNITIIILLCITSYLLGSFPSGYILTKSIKNIDLRTQGSKTTGATNTMRTLGPKLGLLALFLDILKGLIVISILKIFELEQFYLIGDLNIIGMYGLFAVIGHVFSIFLNFKGGKAVATSLGVLTFLNPFLGLVVIAVAITIIYLTKYVSLGSMIGAIVGAVGSGILFFINPDKYLLETFITLTILTLIILIKHKDNIIRLKNGNENKISF